MGLYDDVLTPQKPTAKAAAPKKGGLYDDVLSSSPSATPAPSAGPAPSLRGIERGAQRGLKNAGKTIAAAHQNPFDTFLGVLGTPQRALEALETGGDIGHAVTHPRDQRRLSRAVKEKIGLQGLEDNQLAGNDLLHKLARGTLDFGLDVANDPLTFAPVGKGLELAGKGIKAVPGAVNLAERVARSPFGTAVEEGASRLFNPEYYLRGLTPEAKAQFEMATNRSMEAVRKQQEAENAIVRKHAAAIRRGELPTEVRNLFTAPAHGTIEHTLAEHFPEGIKPGTRPQEVQAALFRNRAPAFRRQVMSELDADTPEFGSLGIFKTPDYHRAAGSRAFTVPPEEIEEVQKRLKTVLQKPFAPANPLLQAAKFLTHRGNQAFLANPVPHTLNLANLAYNRYGVPTVVKGLANAARVATGTAGGKLGKKVSELEDLGAKSQYGNLFDELGLTRIAGIPGTEGVAKALNAFAIVPAERLANYAQHKILNSTETGLRAAALDAERAAGNTGAAAAKNIHSAFGTDAPNNISRGASALGTPFARFHLQTAPGSGLRTLATHPARVVNPIKAQRDYNNQVNPHGPKYQTSIPAMATARAVVDPAGYWLGNFGPIAGIEGVRSTITKGGLDKIAGDTAARFIPGTPEYQALMYLISKKASDRKKGVQAIGPAIVGGYYKK